MRLAHEAQITINDTICQAEIDAIIYFFRSQADDAAKGGDIDVLVLQKNQSDGQAGNSRAIAPEKLGQRKADIAVFPILHILFPEWSCRP